MPDEQQTEQQNQRQFDRKHFLSGLAAGRMLRGFPFRRPDFVVTGPAPRPAERDGPILTFRPWAERSRADLRFTIAEAEAAMVEALVTTQYRYGLDAAGIIFWKPTTVDILTENGLYRMGAINEGYHSSEGHSTPYPMPLTGTATARTSVTVSYRYILNGSSVHFRFENGISSVDRPYTDMNVNFFMYVTTPVTGTYVTAQEDDSLYQATFWSVNNGGQVIDKYTIPVTRHVDAGRSLGTRVGGTDLYYFRGGTVTHPAYGGGGYRILEGDIPLPSFFIDTSASIPWGPRAGDINGHFGILDEHGLLLPLTETTRIVDEANRAVYDPFDRTWYSISNYIYDYETRTYYMNLSDSLDPSSASIVAAFNDASVSFSREGSGGGEGSAGTIYYIALDIGQDAFFQGLIVGSRLREWAMARRGIEQDN